MTPLLGKSELRKNGVSLHLLLNERRESISGVPAVYLVEPSEENIRRIIQDLSTTVYELAYLNFTSAIPREMMTLLAELAVEKQCTQRIRRVGHRCWMVERGRERGRGTGRRGEGQIE